MLLQIVAEANKYLPGSSEYLPTPVESQFQMVLGRSIAGTIITLRQRKYYNIDKTHKFIYDYVEMRRFYKENSFT